MKVRKKWWWIAAALPLLLFMAWRIQHPPPLSYQTVVVVAQDLIISVLASGQLDALNKVEVGTQISGQLQQLAVKLGEKVNQDQLLAVIDPTRARNRVAIEKAKLQALQAALAEVRAALALAHLKQQRLVELVQAQAKTRAELDEAGADITIKRAKECQITAQIEQQRLEWQQARSDLAQTRIVAPMAGRVVALQIKVGQTVVSAQAASPILTLADLQQMVVRTYVSEADIPQIKIGLAAEFSLLGDPQRRFSGTIREIGWLPTKINNALFYPVLFDVDNADGLLRIDMTAQVAIILEHIKETPVIPLAALGPLQADGRYQVQVLVAGKPQLRQVMLGKRNEVVAQVVEGVELGETVIVKTLQEKAP